MATYRIELIGTYPGALPFEIWQSFPTVLSKFAIALEVSAEFDNKYPGFAPHFVMKIDEE